MLVIITGTSKGIGFELMKQFAQTDVLVIAVSRNIKSIEAYIKKNDLTNILPLSIDISTKSGIDKVTKVCKYLNKPVSILINNAGSLISKPFKKISEKQITDVYKTNVFAPFLLTQALLPYMGLPAGKSGKKKGTHIINISSMGGVQGTAKFAGLSAYSSSKAALCGLTECLAEELKGTNISVNCLALGAVQTEMLSKAFPGYKAPIKADQMASYIYEFALNGHKYYNGKVLPVSLSTP
ncbi:MAG: SDR family oxidoreductase [Bacteroidota bacterium]|nr:SDR family oxidoreductase [Bacteroidota bacterium]